jgi:hypothetical protein
MFRFSFRARLALSLAFVMAAVSMTLPAQTTTRSRRESATRRAHIARDIEQTYSHRWDIFGGGGYLRFRSGESLQKNNEVTWAVNAAYNFDPKWSVVGDVRGSYGNAKVGNNIYNVYNPLITEYTLMAGPQYRFYRHEKYAISAHVLGGVAMGNFDGGSKGVSAYRLGMWDTDSKPAFSAGVNFDYNFYTNLAFRLTPTYVGTMFRGRGVDTFGNLNGTTNGSIQNNIGVNVGVVYRFGHQ